MQRSNDGLMKDKWETPHNELNNGLVQTNYKCQIAYHLFPKYSRSLFKILSN